MMLAEGFAFVPFEADHLQDMARLQKKVYPECYQESIVDLNKVYAQQKVLGASCMCADKVVGYVMGFPIPIEGPIPVIQTPDLNWAWDTFSHFPKSQTPVFLYDCVFDPDFQGKGLGSKLVKSFINECSLKGYKRIWAAAVGDGAGKFWEKLGFQKASSVTEHHAPQEMDSDAWWRVIEAQKNLPEIYKTTGKDIFLICETSSKLNEPRFFSNDSTIVKYAESSYLFRF
jgi:GNAT superfamily N-acetyltransferase